MSLKTFHHEVTHMVYTVGRNARWCSHSGKQYGGSSKHWKHSYPMTRNCTTGYLSKDINVVIQRSMCTPMFTAAMSTIAKLWKEPRCPSTYEWKKKIWHIYTMECCAAIKRNEILPFAMMWMALEGIMLSEISQSEKDNYHMISPVWESGDATWGA